MSRRKKRFKTGQPNLPPPRRPWGLLAAVAAVLLIAGGSIVWWQSSQQPAIPIEVTGAPRVAVAQAAVNHGDIKFDTPVSTIFQVSNVGDQPLRILGEPQVELVEGC